MGVGKESMTSTHRIGIGHDTHRLIPGGPLRLGGVDVPHASGADGHSDADVLLHALIDALLGALAAGDIGQWFPDTDAANRGRDSADMLRIVYQQLQQAGYRVVNVDCIVFAQQPKLGEYKVRIRQRLAELLEVDPAQVGLKAKTGEGVGSIGRAEAIAAQCVVLLDRAAPAAPAAQPPEAARRP